MMAEAFLAELAARRMMTDEARYAINIGCGDGIEFNDPVYPLYKAGYTGVAIDGFDHEGLRRNLGGFDVVAMPGTSLNNDNILDVLASAKCPPRPAFLKIDIDGIDADILRTILAGGIRPLVIQAEINTEIPPPYAFSVCSSAKFAPGSEHNFYGFSLSYGLDLLSSFGYEMVNLDFETGWTHDGLWADAGLLARLGAAPFDPQAAFFERAAFLCHIEAVTKDVVASWRTRTDRDVVRNEIWTTMMECSRLKLGHTDVPFELYISQAAAPRSEDANGSAASRLARWAGRLGRSPR